jgi:hypothetical protein
VVVGLLTTLCACGDSASAPSTPSNPAVRSIAISGTAPIVGSTSQFTATATRADGSTANVTSLATWQSSNTNIATVNAQGLVSAVGTGSVGISASYSGAAGSLALVVGNGLFDIEGDVFDVSTNPNRGVVGAHVVVTGTTSGTATTDAFARYSVRGLAGPPFTVSVTFNGYIPVTRVLNAAGSDGKFHGDFYISPSTACPTLGFDDLTIDRAPVTTSSMCGFMLTTTTTNWVAAVAAPDFGVPPGPFIFFDTPAGTSTVAEAVVTSVSGRTFRLQSLDLRSVSTISHAITGRLGSTVVLTIEGTTTSLNFVTLSNPHPFTMMDSLVIRLTTMTQGRSFLDNIRLAE